MERFFSVAVARGIKFVRDITVTNIVDWQSYNTEWIVRILNWKVEIESKSILAQITILAMIDEANYTD